MSQRTITRMFDSRDDALAAVRDLEAAGFSHDDLGIIATDADASKGPVTKQDHGDAAGSGTGIGGLVGGLVGGAGGLAAALGAIAIPGIGPLVAAGALATTVVGAGAGAVTGGLVGNLAGHGVKTEEAPVYAEGMRRGGSIVTVRAEESRAAEVETVLNRHNPVDISARESEYRAAGWQGYDDTVDTGTRDSRSTLSVTDPVSPAGPLGGRQI